MIAEVGRTTHMKQESLSVLLIEDDSLEAALVRDEIAVFPRTSAQVDHVHRLLAGIARLTERRYDIVLLDLNLPDGSGIESLHKVKTAAPNVPVVILTNMEDQEAAVAMVAEGAQDYVIKRHITSELLRRSIRYAIARQEAEAELRSSEERFALAVAGARDGIWDWDLTGGVIHFSPRWFELLQMDGIDELPVPATWFDRVHPEDQVGLDQALNAHLRGDSPYLEHEFRMTNGVGESMWVLCRAVAIRDGSGRATRIAGSLTDISDRKLAEARLVHEALHDTLTGLPNRALFLDRLGLTLKQQRRDPKRTFGVLFLDLDGFKTINDSLGHAAGDELLIEFGKRLSMFLRPGDSVARLGGDEFAILLTDISGINEATRVAERIHDLLSLKFVIGDKEVYATASIGIAMSEPSYERPGDLLRDADMAMYRAKSSRTGSYSVFHSVDVRVRPAAVGARNRPALGVEPERARHLLPADRLPGSAAGPRLRGTAAMVSPRARRDRPGCLHSTGRKVRGDRAAELVGHARRMSSDARLADERSPVRQPLDQHQCLVTNVR